MFRTIGIIGSGLVGRAIARHAAANGYEVVMASTKPVHELQASLQSEGLAVRAVDVAAAANSDLIVLALPFARLEALAEAVPVWTGKTVIDATNQFATFNPYRGRADTEGLTGSEWVAKVLSGATVIKAFNAMFGQYIAARPRHAEGRQIVFLAGDPSRAKSAVIDLIAGLGFAPVDLGGLADGGRLIQLDGPLNGVNALRQG